MMTVLKKLVAEKKKLKRTKMFISLESKNRDKKIVINLSNVCSYTFDETTQYLEVHMMSFVQCLTPTNFETKMIKQFLDETVSKYHAPKWLVKNDKEG